MNERARERRQIHLEILDAIPEGTGHTLRNELKQALEKNDKETTLTVLKKIGDTIHARWGNPRPTTAIYNEMSNKYELGLSTQTSGTRLFINTKPYDQHPGDLIFPNVLLDHKINGKTLADVFEELFTTEAENIQPESTSPYYIIKIGTTKTKDQ